MSKRKNVRYTHRKTQLLKSEQIVDNTLMTTMRFDQNTISSVQIALTKSNLTQNDVLSLHIVLKTHSQKKMRFSINQNDSLKTKEIDYSNHSNSNDDSTSITLISVNSENSSTEIDEELSIENL